MFKYFVLQLKSLCKYTYFQKPFLEGVEHLTEDVVSVFPAADSLEQYVIALITSTCEEGTADSYYKKLALYKVSNDEEKKRLHFHLVNFLWPYTAIIC